MKVNKKFTITIILCIIISIFISFNYMKNTQDESDIQEESITQEELESAYEDCLNQTYSEDELTEEINTKIEELNQYVENYNVSIYFEDLDSSFTYTYNPTTVYYGCSLIKLVDALYLIEKATEGEIDLDTETITYTSEYKRSYSQGMATKSYGEEVSLRELISYAIMYSDNSAHIMLIDYIGFYNLQEYGQSLGGQVILQGGDKYGNQTAEDMNVYLKKAYEIITTNEEYGPFLKEIMDNDDNNDFNTDDIKIYHKYGSYNIYFHDVGLALDDEHPYTISILTELGNSNHQEVIQNIHSMLIEIHDLLYGEKSSACQIQIYGE
ncbi:MAG: class A beta-lactamase-related serine hydrolase [Erysipelotrichaceae bacterium]|nr:class A beta-lactamase-related serine hydrolase [Erysipelotrichaceae bacterium]